MHANKLYDDVALPDNVIFIKSVPNTSVGKFDKKVLREQFKDHALSDIYDNCVGLARNLQYKAF